MSRLTKQQIKRLPPYIRLGDKEKGTAMRLDNPGEGLFGNDEYDVEYLRDGGMWSVGVKEVDGKFLSIFNDDDEDWFEEMVLIPAVEEIRSANPRIIEVTDTEIVVDLGCV